MDFGRWFQFAMNAATALTIASSTNTGFALVSGVVEEAEDAPVT
jgi:hypothetical protein